MRVLSATASSVRRWASTSGSSGMGFDGVELWGVQLERVGERGQESEYSETSAPPRSVEKRRSPEGWRVVGMARSV